MILISLLLLLILLTSTSESRSVKNESKKRQLVEKLFPNQTFHFNNQQQSPRELTTVPCVICRDLTYCSVLNGLQIQEVYFPQNLQFLGTCYVLEDLATRLFSEIFGTEKSFRDTPQCRDIVMQYLCLFWGSNNPMYVNNCVYQEDVSSANPANHKVAPRPPCRSFCVQVAQVCAIDDEFVQLCPDIACPPTEDACTPDPIVDGQVLGANLGCSLPYDLNPYVRIRGSASSLHLLKDNLLHHIHMSLLLSVSILFAVLFYH